MLNPYNVLVILYIVGIVGVTLPLHKDFMLLTPVNLLVTFFLALYADKNKTKTLYVALIICYITGVLIELVGVQSGLLFGEYSYGKTLGPKIFGTPFIIGLNWAMLVYASVSFSNRFIASYPIFIKSILGATIMVLLDVLIEPVAVKYDFWTWSAEPLNNIIVAPIQNYTTWWIAAFLLNIVVHKMVPELKNNAIELLYCLQCLFFGWIILFVL